MIHSLLGAAPEPPLALLEDFRRRIALREMPVADLAKSENLSQDPSDYEALMAQGGKPRRAAAEAALQLNPRPAMGERMAYYITPRSKGRTADWQRARPVALFDPVSAPYDPGYYTDKLDDWLRRYGSLLGLEAKTAASEVQEEMF
jgi:DNA polymerase elongation subunit (family B)